MGHKHAMKYHKCITERCKSTTAERHLFIKATQTTSTETDRFHYRYLINEPHLCASLPKPYVINLVPTAPQDCENRSLIRRRWANDKWTKSTFTKTVFHVGETSDPQVMTAVTEESNIHHDIIQFSFRDSYDNLTLKILSGLHRVKNFCFTPTWILKSDADVLVNIFELTRYKVKEKDTPLEGLRKGMFHIPIHPIYLLCFHHEKLKFHHEKLKKSVSLHPYMYRVMIKIDCY